MQYVSAQFWQVGAILAGVLALYVIGLRVALWPRCWPKASRRWPRADRPTLLMGAVMGAPVLALGPLLPLTPVQVALLALFAIIGAGAAGHDVRRGLLPDPETFALAALGAVAAWQTGAVVSGLIAATLGAALFTGLILVWQRLGRSRNAMGWGDVKLVAALGLWVGMAGLGALIGVAALGGLVLARRDPDRATVRFGPCLIGAAWLVVLAIWLDIAAVVA